MRTIVTSAPSRCFRIMRSAQHHDPLSASMEADKEEAADAGSSERYYCPYPNCKRSFAELWRLKVHYRAPPDIRGSGKERGHGTELTHCPKCGKGLKPGKHHVGCSGGKAGLRQNKRARLGGGNGSGLGMDGMPGNVYNVQLQYGQAAPMPSSITPGMQSGLQQQQQQQPMYMSQQYQPEMAAAMYTGHFATNLATGAGMQPQAQGHTQQQQSSPALSMGVIPDQLTESVMSGGTASGLHSTAAGEAGMMQIGQGYYQQQPQQTMQTMSLDASGMVTVPSMQHVSSMQLLPMQEGVPGMTAHSFTLPASSQYMAQAQQQPQHQQQQQLDAGLYVGGGVDAVPVAAATAGLMLPPQPVQVQMAGASQQQKPLLQQQQQQQHQQQSPQVMTGVPVQAGSVQLTSAGSGVLMMQVGTGAAPHQYPQQQMLPPALAQQHQHQQVPTVHVPPSPAMQALGPASSSLQSAGSTALTPLVDAQRVPSQLGRPGPQQQDHQQQPASMAHINSNMFDEIDGGFDMQHPPSPPPLPSDFSAASGTLFNFAQFSQKLPAAVPPSQQMAMMPRGMEQELPPSIDELWTPEATYDHHSDGDLMQLLFGAPEQPPTMATIHLHHFLDDDACSSPGMLAGILHNSMDDLRAAAGEVAGGEAAAATAAAGQDPGGAGGVVVKQEGSTAVTTPPVLEVSEQQSGGALGHQQPGQQQQQQAPAALASTGVKTEGLEQQPQHQHQHVVVPPPAQYQQQVGFVPVQAQPPDCRQQYYVDMQQQAYGAVAAPYTGMNSMNGMCNAGANGYSGMNGMNGVNAMSCLPSGSNGMLPSGQCGPAAVQVHMSLQLNMQQQDMAAGTTSAGSGILAIKGEEDPSLRMQQKAVVAAATLP